MGLAAFTQPDINIGDMVEAASLLSPIAYLGHASAGLVLRLVNMHLDEVCPLLLLLIYTNKFVVLK